MIISVRATPSSASVLRNSIKIIKNSKLYVQSEVQTLNRGRWESPTNVVDKLKFKF